MCVCVCVEGGNVCGIVVYVCVVMGCRREASRDHAIEWVGETRARMWLVNTLTSRTGTGSLRGHIHTNLTTIHLPV